jgi:hypothetical protein
MHRTTILLPETLRRDAEKVARGQGITLSELIRRKLAHSVASKARVAQDQDPFFRPGRLMTRSGAIDVSANHDDYLYGKKAKRHAGKASR